MILIGMRTKKMKQFEKGMKLFAKTDYIVKFIEQYGYTKTLKLLEEFKAEQSDYHMVVEVTNWIRFVVRHKIDNGHYWAGSQLKPTESQYYPM